MPAPKITHHSLAKRIVTAVRNDPQKAGILTVLVAILLVLQVRLQMSDKGGPSQTRAGVTAKGGKSGGAGSTGALAYAGGSHNGQFGGTAGGGAEGSGRPLDAAAALRVWMDQPAVPIERNLFAVNLDRFPQTTARPVEVVTTPKVTFWDELAKSVALRADVKKERQILIENLTQQASQLRLQSTLMGASPKAVINGELVGEGDVVASGSGESRVTFRVLKIEARRILIEREGIKLEIQMK